MPTGRILTYWRRAGEFLSVENPVEILWTIAREISPVWGMQREGQIPDNPCVERTGRSVTRTEG